MSAQPFRVDLAGVVKLLSEHLYSGSHLFVRELLQNGVDAISMRQRLEPNLRGRIAIEVTPSTDSTPASLCVRDNGIGLTLQETTDLLATIGASSKRAVDEARRSSFIGQFGVGLLSCFLVSDEVTVTTRSSAVTEAPEVQWVGRSDGTFRVSTAISTAGVAEYGTAVRLTARQDSVQWFDEGTVTALASRFGELLPVEVTVTE